MLIFALIARYLIPMIKTKLNAGQLESLRMAIQTGVYAAEMLYNSEQGQQKLAYVIDLLAQQGYVVDKDHISATLRAMIEAMVKELKLEMQAVEKIA